MAEPVTTVGTTVPSQQGGVFPPFDTGTYPSQLLWLAVTFAVLFVVLWRVAGPRIGGVIGERKARIANDLGTAEKHRKEAESAEESYQSALASARSRAQKVTEENRKQVMDDVEKSKAAAEAEAQETTAKAEARIAAMRQEAARHVTIAAQDAAAAIVVRLIGDTISPQEAEAAVKALGA
ncbi:MAG: F0F1 ATP synthase subunit B' [Alphaproteobacteria bacterium]|nr:F0F1 ATP synthase subunit B' [Alphaproteobacteria bacterium]MDE2110724.1 F0F1 ATP synthase subunit B' [Alphaproteobacteria bacterium]MDE2494529.1 F0F1 ATP synthase subunit B' [Alphaproteobacteria bacterium]